MLEPSNLIDKGWNPLRVYIYRKCNRKRKWNNLESRRFNEKNTGQTGATGSQGAPGPQGPFYQVGTAVIDVTPDELGSAEVSCDEGDVAISGSGRFLVAQNDNLRSTADLRINNTSWIAELNFDGVNNGGVQAFAICLDNPPLRP